MTSSSPPGATPVSVYTAWLDESGSNQKVDPGTYILSAAVDDPAHAQDMRDTMRDLLVNRRHKKLHWRDEDFRRQDQIIKTVAELPVEHPAARKTTNAIAKPFNTYAPNTTSRRLCT